jgi:hypothetical protein
MYVCVVRATYKYESGECKAPAEVAATRNSAGKQLRLHILRRYISGKFVAEDVTLIAHYHTESGGCGLEEL